MKKILTMLLSFLMVATLGVVNVSAENKSYVFNINASKDTTYSGEAQTLFEFGGLNEDIGKKLEGGYSIYYSVKEGSGFNNQAEEITWTKYSGETLTIKKSNAGHYYFKAAVIKSTASTIGKSLNDIGSDNYSSDTLGEAEIAKKVVTVSIKAPMTAKEGGESVKYFDVGDKEVTLPFSATTDVTGVALKWDLKKESTSNIEYDSTTSTLTIHEGLLSGVHEVTLTASVSDETNYKGSASVSFKVIKATTAGYVIAFDGSKYNQTSQKNESVFGKTVNEISNGVSSISYRDSTYNVWTKDSTTTSITSKTLSDRDGNVLSKGKLNAGKDYQIKATVKTTYYYDGEEQSYSFDVSDKFDVVAKEALATVKAKEDLVYSGKNQDLTECTAKDPLSATVKYKVTNTKLGEVSAEAYDILDATEVDTPTGKDAGTYYVYYHVIANDTQNYKDSYGMVEVTIDKATLTVSGLEDKEYDYDGKDKLSTVKDAISVDGVADGEENPYTIGFTDSDSNTVTELKNAGTYKVSIALNDENGNYKFASDTATSATVTINAATANMVWATTKTTYYKNTETTAVLTCDGVYGDFLDLQIKTGENEWKEVSKSNYDAHSGSTVIVLKKDYLQTLEVGKDYTFRLVYGANYINYPTTVLAVREYTAPSNSSSSSSSTTTTTTTTTAKKVVNTSAH